MSFNGSLRGFAYCRACGSDSLRALINLGDSPIANYLPNAGTVIMEAKYPLNLVICNSCNLGQINEFETPDQIFSDYPYLSSTSSSWLKHADTFCDHMLSFIPKLDEGYVLELASNDGYLLEKFLKRGIKVLGVDPARNVAPISQAKGIKTVIGFFGTELAETILEDFGNPKLIVANNVAAHVPNILDFFSGIFIMCNDETIVTIENPTLGTLLEQNLYDTIYHEHFSYLSVEPVAKLAKRVGLELFKVESLPTHGGSFRYWLRKPNKAKIDISVLQSQEIEKKKGLGSQTKEKFFSEHVTKSMQEIRNWVSLQPNKSIVGYGAAAKTVTTFYSAGLDANKFNFIVDANNLKQGRRLPGTDIQILSVDNLMKHNSSVLIFPWNISEEIIHSIRMINPSLDIWIPNPLRKIL